MWELFGNPWWAYSGSIPVVVTLSYAFIRFIKAYCFERKDRAVSPVNGYYRCVTCKSTLIGGFCVACGPYGRAEYVSGMPPLVNGGVVAANSAGGGGGGGANSASTDVFDTCTSCGWRVYSRFNTPRPCPICGSNSIVYGLSSAPMKPVIRSSGMAGYSENGTPDEWDMALGTIRGYRWFKLDIPESWAGVRKRQITAGYYDVNGQPEVLDEGPRVLSDEELPGLVGAYGRTWEAAQIEARCKNYAHHEPPEWRETCGCGFWGYFDPNLEVNSVLSWQNSSTGSGWTPLCVFAAIEGSGRVIIGEKGFRSQYAKIEAVCIGKAAVPKLCWWQDNASCYGQKIMASDDEVYRRLAMIEELLMRRYPGVRVLSSQSTLAALYPPDPNYSGGK